MKITAWNGEWLEDDWGVFSGAYAPRSRRGRRRRPSAEVAEAKITGTKEYLRRIAPEILFLCEGPVDPDATEAFAAHTMPEMRLVRRRPGDSSNVDGDQGMWFFVHRDLFDTLQPELLDNAIWRAAAHAQKQGDPDKGKWWTIRPRLREIGEDTLSVNERRTYGHSRHPQVMRIRHGDEPVEFIGLHLKSKFVGFSPRKLRPGESFEAYASEPRVFRYLTKSHEARVKLTSQAMNVRAYIDHRFLQDADPAIFVLGDINDGPGKELMEREYMLHDMISNLQGDIFFSRGMLYHALFDLPQELRWTCRFEDKIDPERDPHILLDHILYTQAMNRTGQSSLRALGSKGKVEHQVHGEVEALFGADAVSDHRAVSMEAVPRAD